jgi:GT2 family glycosyltransferase
MTTDKQPRIAVLLPAYNAGPDLAVTLDSLRQQGVPSRLYLVDDGSPRKPDYAPLIAGMDCKLIELPKNLGITGAMNAGLAELMKGRFDYIARIDAGDAAMPERFAKQVAYLDAHPEIAILGASINFHQFDSHGTLIGNRTIHFPEEPEACRTRLYSNSSASHPAMMIRREVFEKLKGYSEDYPAAEDYDLLWRAVKAGFKISNLPDVLLVKEENPGSISQRRRRRQVLSRLQIQMANFNAGAWQSWRGIAKGLAVLAMPSWLVVLLKNLRRG